ncbi:MAG: hypothetical protein N3A54_03355 [Patescibacteria group bacterium]|nr:hypothetical protein [Patescibacteria group bacterium]
MRNVENSLQKFSHFLKETVDIQEIKKNFLITLLEKYFPENKRAGMARDLLSKDKKSLQYWEVWNYITDYVTKIYKDNNLSEKESFYKKVILKIFEVFYSSRTKRIDSLTFLWMFLRLHKLEEINLDYNSFVEIIKKSGKKILSLPEKERELEAKIDYMIWISLLWNLYFQTDPYKQPFKLISEIMNHKDVEVFAKIVEPCIDEIVNIIINGRRMDEAMLFLVTINKRSQVCENYILEQAKKGERIWSFDGEYIRQVLGGRFRDLEEIIKRNKYQLSNYVHYGLRQEAPDLEPYMVKDPVTCFKYASLSLDKKRVPHLEPIIASDPLASVNYAIEVLRDRFPMGEKTIYQDGKYIKVYEDFLNKKGIELPQK